MSDPKRLFDDGADELGRALLRAGRTLDAEQARDRKLAMLGAAGAGAAAAAAAAAAPSAAKGALHLVSAAALKWLSVGILAAVVTAGGAAYITRSAPEAGGRPENAGAATPNPSNSVISDGNAAELASSREARSDEIGGAPVDPGGVAPQAVVVAPSREAPHAEPKSPSDPSDRASASAAIPPEESLSAEVEALKRAREALAAGRPKKALTELNIYDKRFRGGRLALEAEVLRIEALALSGEGKAAAARAASFLAAHPSSPYANRVRAVAEAPLPPASE